MKNEKPIYEDYKKMIQKMSWKYAKRSFIEQDELEAQGNLIFCEALAAYDSSRGASFCTYLYTCLNNGLLSFVMGEQKTEGDETLAIPSKVEHEDGCSEYVLEAKTPAPDRSLEFMQVINGMSNLSAAVCNTALRDYKLLGLAGDEHPREARGVIARKLNESGVEWGVVWNTMREIKTTLCTV